MEWIESIVIERPLPHVQAAIADEHQLMTWSAWPAATGYRCVVEGDGGSLGSAIVFSDSGGTEQGRRRLSRVEVDRVEYRLRNNGPGGRVMTPEVDFRLEALGASRTWVHLDSRATAPLPRGLRHVAELLLGRWVRRLHVEDLELLKAHVEQVPTPTP